MKNDRIKNNRIKSDRMKNDRIKSDRIKTDHIKSITDPFSRLNLIKVNCSQLGSFTCTPKSSGPIQKFIVNKKQGYISFHYGKLNWSYFFMVL
jgi:hypothetical protein